MSRFTGFSEKSLFKKKNEILMGKLCAVTWCYPFKFLEEIRFHWLFHVGFGEIGFLKWHDVINSNSSFLAILIKVFRFAFIQANIFFLKLNWILTKIDISCVSNLNTRVLDPPTDLHQFDANYGKIWYRTVWVTL